MRSLTLITLCALSIIVVSGCLMFYTGSEEGPFKVVAVRNEPGRPQEAILQSECRANWEVVFGPDGGGPTYFKGIRYYIASGGRTNDLSYATRWAYNLDEIVGPIAIPGTDRWVLVYEDDKTPDLVTLDVRLFTAKKLIDKFKIKEVLRGPCTGPLRWGSCRVSADGRKLTFATTGGDCVLDAATGELTRPKGDPDAWRAKLSDIRKVEGGKEGEVALYDYEKDKILWSVPDRLVLSSRTDTNLIITCSWADKVEFGDELRYVLRLRDGTGSELVRREVKCLSYEELAASPSLKRVAYTVERNGGKLRPSYDDTRDASLCVETFEGTNSTKRNVFDIGVGRQLEFEWVTDDILFGTWKVRPKDYDHYDYVVIDVRTGKWRKLPLDTDYYRGFAVDVAAGCVRLRPRRGTCRLYNALRDEVTDEPSRTDWPNNPADYRFEGFENGVGMVYVGQGNWVLVGWDGKLVKSGALSRRGVGGIERALGHGRLSVRLFDSEEKAVLSSDNKLIIRGCNCLPCPDGLFLLRTLNPR